LVSALLWAVVLAALVALTVAQKLQVWVCVLIAVGLAVGLFIPIRGRLLLLEWPAEVLAFLGRRRGAVRPSLAAAVDISVISGEAGVRWEGATLVAAVEVAPTLALAMESGGRSATDSELPLGLVASLMEQYGLRLDIDIVSSGRHVPPGTGYRTVYSQAVGPRHLVGQRRTWLVLRLNVIDNLDGVVERGPSRQSAPKALAAAAHRVAQRLQQEEIRCYVLSADDLDAMADLLLAPMAGDSREKWSTISSESGFITTFSASTPELLAEGQLDRWWAWRTEDILMTVRLTADSVGRVSVGVLLRYVQHGKPEKPLPEAKLAVGGGQQIPMLAAALPGGDSSLAATMPTVELAKVAAVRLPIGPSGQILGQFDEGTLVAAPLWDQSTHPKRWRVDAHLGMELAHQIVLRAVVTGAVVALHTDHRNRWDSLVGAVGDNSRLFYATAGARTCDIAIFDGRPVGTVPARTMMRMLEGGAGGGGADMTLVERSGQLLDVSIGAGAPQTLLVIRSREEDRYLGLGEAQAAPRRVVSTEPVLSRPSRRAPAPPTPTPTAPRPPAPSAVPGGGRAPRVGVGPQRVPRSQRPAGGGNGQGPARESRDYQLPPER